MSEQQPKKVGRPTTVGPGPWWIFATFDENWKVVSVEPESGIGSELIDEGASKKLRLIDEPFSYFRTAKHQSKWIKRAYEGVSKATGRGRTQMKVIHVDRNPPNYVNRDFDFKKP